MGGYLWLFPQYVQPITRSQSYFMKNVPLHPVWVSGELQLVCDSWYFLQNDSKRVAHVNKLFLKGPQDVNTGVTMAKLYAHEHV